MAPRKSTALAIATGSAAILAIGYQGTLFIILDHIPVQNIRRVLFFRNNFDRNLNFQDAAVKTTPAVVVVAAVAATTTTKSNLNIFKIHRIFSIKVLVFDAKITQFGYVFTFRNQFFDV